MARPRIVFASYALPGHINKCAVLAAELAERGHSVLFATQQAGRAALAHPGIRHVAWEPGGDFVARLRDIRGAISEEPNERRRLGLSEGGAADVYASAFTALDTALRSAAPDMLVVEQVATPGIDLAHARRWPLVIQASYVPPSLRLGVGARSPWPRRVRSLRWLPAHALAYARLQRVRRECSRCARLDELLRRTPIVSLSDPSIEGAGVAGNVHLVGSLIPRTLPPLPAATRDWIDARASDGFVLVAFGTLVRLRESLLVALAEGLAACDAAVLWALPERHHQLVQRHSRSFRAETFVPQTTVLSHPALRAFVTHAGGNSALEAMSWGRPTLALPFMFDQHHYARRVADLGLGLALDPHAATRYEVRTALRRVLHERAFADAGRRMATRLQQAPGVTGAADIVEAELARHRA